uniref:Secreted protein n=1 Tax=Heterorhabditis bacteriophora TaxID=37862 RepID=A0A1I7WVC8_HETBA
MKLFLFFIIAVVRITEGSPDWKELQDVWFKWTRVMDRFLLLGHDSDLFLVTVFVFICLNRLPMLFNFYHTY